MKMIEFYIDPFSQGGCIFRLLAINFDIIVPNYMIDREILYDKHRTLSAQHRSLIVGKARAFLPSDYVILNEFREGYRLARKWHPPA